VDDYKTDDELLLEQMHAAEWANDLLGHDNAVFLIRRKGRYLGKICAMDLHLDGTHMEKHLREAYGAGIYSVCANVDGAIRDKHHQFLIGEPHDRERADHDRALAGQKATNSDEEAHDDRGTASETESEKLSRVVGEFLTMCASMPPAKRR
jgi:hypothetical protein